MDKAKSVNELPHFFCKHKPDDLGVKIQAANVRFIPNTRSQENILFHVNKLLFY